MKKMFKFAIVISIVLALLSPNMIVIAAEVSNDAENTEKEQQVENTVTAEQKPNNNENTSTGNVENEVTDEEDNTVNADENSTNTTNSKTNAKKTEPADENNNSAAESSKQNSNNSNATENMPIENIDYGIQTINAPEESVGIPGRLDVTINLKLPNNTLTADYFTVTLQKNTNGQNDPTVQPIPLSSSSGGNGKLYYEFLNIPTHPTELTNYNLKITGKNYQTYSQIISVKSGQATTIEIQNSFDVNSTSTGTTKRAVMGVGSINTQNNAIGETDINQMISTIEKKQKDYDLNGDKEVNIIDLSYIAINKGKQTSQEGDYGYDQIVEVNQDTFAKQDVNTHIDETNGKLEDILKNNDKFVSVGPVDTQKEISASNPVELTINLGEENKTETEEITIAPSTNPDNNIQSGETEIVYEENGEEKTIITTIGNAGEVVAKVQKLYKLASTVVSDTTKIATTGSTPKVIANEGQAVIESDGTIVINLGKKVAVKKVTIRVTGTKSKKLADIAKVEFLNDMEDRIPAPVIEAPSHLGGEATYDSLVIYWDAMLNVTGYELEIKATINGVERVEYHQVDANQITLNQFYTEDFKDQHYTDFHIRVQSVNGEWKSGYGETITLTPKPNKVPDAPDNLFVKSGIREITATWKNMKSTRTYDVEYKKFDDPDSAWTTAASEITENKITIKNLEDKVKYQVRVRGINELGKGPWCTPGEATTTVVEPAILPSYGVINSPKVDSNGNELEGRLTQHIVNATYGRNIAYMVDSPLDEAVSATTPRSALGVVDNTFTSYWQVNDWDDGGFYKADDNTKGLTVEFDEEYKMNYFTMAQIENLGTIGFATIYYWEADENGNVSKQKQGPIKPSQMVTRRDKNGRDYIVIKLAEPINAKKINIQLGRHGDNTMKMTIAEMRFYHYDSLEDEVNALFTDQMHLKLADGVTKETIDKLKERVDTPDENGEYNPESENIKIEIQLAYDILNDANLQDEIVNIDTTVTSAKDSHITFRGGLNAWQPLGIVAHSNEAIKIYVGNPNKKIGDSTNIKLITTQYHAEAAYWKGSEKTLKVGINEITVPQVITSSKEKGGSLYIEYTGNNPSEQYAVRVSGGDTIPVLDLTKYDRTDVTNRKAAVEKYVSELEESVPKLIDRHNSEHKGSKIEELEYDYYNEKGEEDCILGATEIVLDQMMYSVSARQILAGLNSSKWTGTNSDKLYNSLVAMEDMIDLFYQHKGLSQDENAGETNQYPSGRLNIRYHIMFAGAAMYAGGQHIGIPYGDVPTLSQGNPIEMANGDKGAYVSGNYFGWGISHEIGHIINESAYVHGEVTNNYFSVLSQAQDTNSSVRFQYPEVYKKVTSGKTGKAQNVFTQLGLYWQFHLANDLGGYNFETYDTYQEQFNNLVFARMDTYAREIAKTGKSASAPKAEGEKGIDLTYATEIEDPKDRIDNNLMRLACAATQRNVLTFFIKWGMVPNENTIRYASQFEKIYEDGNNSKEKAIWYINDDARAYQLAQKPRMSTETTVTAEVADGEQKNQKVLTLGTANNEVADAILGYEINRISWSYGEEVITPIGFITAEELAKNGGKYTDTIESINNRVFEYRIVAYDKYLNSTEQYITPQFKVEHDGNVGQKSEWEISTNFLTEEEKQLSDKKNGAENKKNSDKSDCSASENEAKGNNDVITAKSLIDGSYDKDYEAVAPDKENGQILIELPEETNLIGLRYKTASNKEIANIKIEVSEDGSNYQTVTQEKTGLISRIMNISLENGFHTIYFNPEGKDKLCVYTARYVRITTTDKNIAIAEIDLLGQTGDNIDFTKAEDGSYQGIGMLQNEVPLGTDSEGNDVSIPAQSIVFTGTYKGNPAYNTPVLYDGEGNQIEIYGAIFADPLDDEKDKLGEVSKGIWVYWVEPGDANYDKVKNELQSVRAELYRTDDAMTLAGERLTSDTYLVKVPRDENGNLPNVRIDKDSNT